MSGKYLFKDECGINVHVGEILQHSSGIVFEVERLSYYSPLVLDSNHVVRECRIAVACGRTAAKDYVVLPVGECGHLSYRRCEKVIL